MDDRNTTLGIRGDTIYVRSETSNRTNYIGFYRNQQGNQIGLSNTNLTFNPSTGIFSAPHIEVSDNLTILKNLNVNGNVNVIDNINTSANLNVNQNINTKNLNVRNISNFLNNLNCSHNINCSQNINSQHLNVRDTLNISGITHLFNNLNVSHNINCSQNINSQYLNIKKNLNVNGNLNVFNNLNVSNNISCSTVKAGHFTGDLIGEALYVDTNTATTNASGVIHWPMLQFGGGGQGDNNVPIKINDNINFKTKTSTTDINLTGDIYCNDGIFDSDMTISSGSITSVSGTINFDDEILTTNGTGSFATGSTIGNLTLANGSITDSGGTINFGSNILTTTGTGSFATGSTIGNLTLANGSITDSGGSISFGNENLTTTGNVGIGTTTPQNELHIDDGSACYINVRGFAAVRGYYGGGNSDAGSGSSDPWLASVDNYITTATNGWLWHHRGTDGDLTLSRRSGSTTDSLVMAFDRSSGNIGINDLTPSYKLDVNGTFRTTGDALLDDDITISSGSITSASGTIDFGNEALTTTGNITGDDIYTGGKILMEETTSGTDLKKTILRCSNDGFEIEYLSDDELTINQSFTSVRNSSQVITTNTYSAQTHIFYDGAVSAGTYARLNSTGLGIGVSPSYALHVVDSGANNPSASAHNFLRNGNASNHAAGAVGANQFNVAIYTTTNVVATGLYSFSDRRIKQNIKPMNSNDGIDIIKKLKPSYFNYIDESRNNTKDVVCGFIAQEVKDVFDYAINTSEDYIPSIYKEGTVCDNIITFDEEHNFTGKNKLIRFFDYDNKIIECVCSVIDTYKIKINEKDKLTDSNVCFESKDKNKIFAYGEKVDDLMTVNKDYIYVVAVSAIQDLIKKNEELDNKINMLIEDNKKIYEYMKKNKR